MCPRKAWHHGFASILLALAAVLAGCGTTKTRSATEQLLMSDAVDRAVATIDFAPLAGKTVYFDTKYLAETKSPTAVRMGFVNSDYVISSLRQQMLAAGCLLQDNLTDAEFVIEGRMGALGTDAHEVTYGIPPSSGIVQAAEMLPNVPRVPVPEIALAKKEDLLGAAKVALFAYHRETRLPVWQSGIAVSTSNARDGYFFGIGPIQDGTIYHGTHFAGSRMQLPILSRRQEKPPTRGLVSYFDEAQFDKIVGHPLETPSPGGMNAEIESLVKAPKLLPLTEQIFAAMSQRAQSAPSDSAKTPAPPIAGAPATPAPSGPPAAGGPAANVAERPKPLPEVTPGQPSAVAPNPPQSSSPPLPADSPAPTIQR